MIPFRLVVIPLAFCAAANFVSAQPTTNNARHIIVNYADSTINTEVWNGKNVSKPNPNYEYYWYQASTISHNKGGYSGKLLHGKYEVFDNQHKLIAQGTFDQGVMTGTWNRWYSNGNLQLTGTYKNGKLQGIVKGHNNKGQRSSITNYDKGLLDGKAYFYYKDTVIVRTYKDGIEMVKVPPKEKVGKEVKKSKQAVQPAHQNPSNPQEQAKPEAKSKKKWWKLPFAKKDTVARVEKPS